MDLCFGAKIRKILGIPLHTKVLLPYIKVGFEGIYLTQTCYPDVNADLYLLLETGNILGNINFPCLFGQYLWGQWLPTGFKQTVFVC